jgi:hypothetical protein
MWYTKQLIFCHYPYFGSVEMLNSSYSPSAPLLMDLSSDIHCLLVVRLPAEPLPVIHNFGHRDGYDDVMMMENQALH